MADLILAIYLYVVAPPLLVAIVGVFGIVVAGALAEAFGGMFNASGSNSGPMDW